MGSWNRKYAGLFSCFLFHATVVRARFKLDGPFLTVSFKRTRGGVDGPITSFPSPELSNDTSPEVQYESRSWFDIETLNPVVSFGVKSTRRPIPVWLPNLDSLRLGMLYSCCDLQKRPSQVEATAKVSVGPTAQLKVQPSYDLSSKQKNLIVQLTNGQSFLRTQLNNHRKRFVEYVQGSILFHLPFASVSTLRISPHWDATQSQRLDQPSCTVETVLGGAGRTKAVLYARAHDPTLAVVYHLGRRHVIASEINLWDAKVTYQWDAHWADGCRLQTRVDPTAAIDISWTDTSTAGGRWLTDIRLPLAEEAPGRGLAADINVRRKFVF